MLVGETLGLGTTERAVVPSSDDWTHVTRVEVSPYAFPSTEAVRDAGALLRREREVLYGPAVLSYFLTIAPGTVALRTRAGYERDLTHEPIRWQTSSGREGEWESCFYPYGRREDDHVPEKRGAITCWSKRSRARMVRTIAELDLADWASGPGTFAMVTLTLPGDWLVVAPTGADFRRMVERFRTRWQRAGVDVRALWKLEFQDRGAPHVHLMMKVPARVPTGEKFITWALRSWAECVGAVGSDRVKHERHGVHVRLEGDRFANPRRVAVYFQKHSAKGAGLKEYQHTVPVEWRGDGKGPGRFWGVWGLKVARSSVCIGRSDFFTARRIMRGIARGRDARMSIARARALGQSSVNFPRVRRHDGPSFGAWILVNDGPTTALAIGRMLTLRNPFGGPRDLRGVEHSREVVRRM